jgi:preprotein translocase subunit SecG
MLKIEKIFGADMAGFPLLAVSFIMKIVAALFLICCVVLILVILIQKGRGGGLSTALAGGVASGILGSKTGDFLTWVTIVVVGVFLALAVLMARFYKPAVSEFGPRQPVRQEQPVQQPAKGGSEQPSPIGEESAASSSANERADSNLPGN